MTKKCSKCGIEKSTLKFRACKHTKCKLQSWCRECQNKQARDRRAAKSPSKWIDRNVTDVSKDCSKCGEHRLFSEFPKLKTAKCGYGSWCRKCVKNLESEKRRSRGIKAKRIPIVREDSKQCLHCDRILLLDSFAPSARGRCGRAAYCRPCAMIRFYDKEVYTRRTRHWRRGNESWKRQHCRNQQKRRAVKARCLTSPISHVFLLGLYSTEICAYCRQNIPRENRTADHVIPLARGGDHSEDNLVMACVSCNSSKQDKLPEEYEVYLAKKASTDDFSQNNCGLNQSSEASHYHICT